LSTMSPRLGGTLGAEGNPKGSVEYPDHSLRRRGVGPRYV
jgi:hypothetical protein